MLLFSAVDTGLFLPPPISPAISPESGSREEREERDISVTVYCSLWCPNFVREELRGVLLRVMSQPVLGEWLETQPGAVTLLFKRVVFCSRSGVTGSNSNVMSQKCQGHGGRYPLALWLLENRKGVSWYFHEYCHSMFLVLLLRAAYGPCTILARAGVRWKLGWGANFVSESLQNMFQYSFGTHCSKRLV